MRHEDSIHLKNAAEGVVLRLQGQFLNGAPEGAATLARLRRGAGKSPGSDPAIWEVTLGSVPESLSGRGDDPSPAEWAIHVALTSYALHQQGKNIGLHRRNVSLGAAAKMARDSGCFRATAFDKRFLSVVSATTHSGLAYHLRSLIPLLRQATSPLDYGDLTVALATLHAPSSPAANKVRLKWGRDYARKITINNDLEGEPS